MDNIRLVIVKTQQIMADTTISFGSISFTLWELEIAFLVVGLFTWFLFKIFD